MEDLVPAPVAIKTHSSSSVTKRETLRKYINPKRILVLARRKKPPAVSQSILHPHPPAMNVYPPVAPRKKNDLVNAPAGAMNVIDLISDSDDDEVRIPNNFIDLAGVPSSPPRAPAAVPAQQQPLPQQQPANGQPQPNGAPPGPNHVAGFNHMNPVPLLNGNVEQGWQQFGDYVLDDDFNDEMIARFMAGQPNEQDGFELEEAQPFQIEQPPAPQPPAAPQPFQFAQPPAPRQPDLPAQPFQQVEAEPQIEDRFDCIEIVLALFPDICQHHVGELYDTVGKSSDLIIAHILDKTENGTSYPKAKDKEKTLKRKREVTEEEAAVQKYGAADRPSPVSPRVGKYIREFLSFEFKSTTMSFIDSTLSLSGYRLFHAYRVLEQAEREWNPANPTYQKLKSNRKMPARYNEQNLQAAITTNAEPGEVIEAILEIQAARKVRAKADEARAAEHLYQLAEEANERQAQLDGTMSECGCCFGDYPMNRMIHCDSDTFHWFCRGCAKQMADTEIGASKYELHCMSMEGCEGGFARDQRLLFLDEPTMIALERTEQEAMLRMAGIENLASCPFCPFAAEYPPVEVNKEFQCQAPDCEKVSCRLCKLESHIPQSCEEFAKENGLSIRRQIEEAMSAALIRKCNTCGAPFIKDEGCNKMSCSKCGNIQCYVCSKSCAYDHFNDMGRGGKVGNCPLFDNIEERHDNEVSKAEKEALEKVRAEHPEYTEEDLKIKISQDVIKDEEARKARNPQYRAQQLGQAAARQQIHDQLVQNRRDRLHLKHPREREELLREGKLGVQLDPVSVRYLNHFNEIDRRNAARYLDRPAGFHLAEAPPPYLLHAPAAPAAPAAPRAPELLRRKTWQQGRPERNAAKAEANPEGNILSPARRGGLFERLLNDGGARQPNREGWLERDAAGAPRQPQNPPSPRSRVRAALHADAESLAARMGRPFNVDGAGAPRQRQTPLSPRLRVRAALDADAKSLAARMRRPFNVDGEEDEKPVAGLRRPLNGDGDEDGGLPTLHFKRNENGQLRRVQPQNPNGEGDGRLAARFQHQNPKAEARRAAAANRQDPAGDLPRRSQAFMGLENGGNEDEDPRAVASKFSKSRAVMERAQRERQAEIEKKIEDIKKAAAERRGRFQRFDGNVGMGAGPVGGMGNGNGGMGNAGNARMGVGPVGGMGNGNGGMGNAGNARMGVSPVRGSGGGGERVAKRFSSPRASRGEGADGVPTPRREWD